MLEKPFIYLEQHSWGEIFASCDVAEQTVDGQSEVNQIFYFAVVLYDFSHFTTRYLN